MVTEDTLPVVAEGHLHLFKKCLPLRLKLHEIVRLVGKVLDSQVCLDIGLDNGMMSYQLRKLGGEWHTVVSSAELVDSIRAVVKDNVHDLKNETLPFKQKVFDIIVVADILERLHSDEQFISECHRVLKHDGKIVIVASRVKSGSFINVLRSLLGLAPDKMGKVRRGYTESQLFNILKHGFDVDNMRSYTRFFVELVDTVARFLDMRYRVEGMEKTEKWHRMYSIAGFFYRIADQMDMLLFLTRGYKLVASAKRRAWHPRNAPVLVDGRSISEAVLSKAAD
ncbi:MAG: methyltransferase domain-containing protein [Lentisphaerae bacterium]|nr:methyltransferase domain-containing protein [Lentisphaerota bacterium]